MNVVSHLAFLASVERSFSDLWRLKAHLRSIYRIFNKEKNKPNENTVFYFPNTVFLISTADEFGLPLQQLLLEVFGTQVTSLSSITANIDSLVWVIVDLRTSSDVEGQKMTIQLCSPDTSRQRHTSIKNIVWGTSKVRKWPFSYAHLTPVERGTHPLKILFGEHQLHF